MFVESATSVNLREPKNGRDPFARKGRQQRVQLTILHVTKSQISCDDSALGILHEKKTAPSHNTPAVSHAVKLPQLKRIGRRRRRRGYNARSVVDGSVHQHS